LRWLGEVAIRYVPLLEQLKKYNSLLQECLRENDEDSLSNDDKTSLTDVQSSHSVLESEMNELKLDLKEKCAALRSQASAENDIYLKDVILPLFVNASIGSDP